MTATFVKLENRTAPDFSATTSRSVNGPVTALDDPAIKSVTPIIGGTKKAEHGIIAPIGLELEDRAATLRPAPVSRAIQGAASRLDERRGGNSRSRGSVGKGVQHGKVAAIGTQAENRAPRGH